MMAAEEWRLFGILGIWQLVALIGLIVLIIFWVMYRRRQM